MTSILPAFNNGVTMAKCRDLLPVNTDEILSGINDIREEGENDVHSVANSSSAHQQIATQITKWNQRNAKRQQARKIKTEKSENS